MNDLPEKVIAMRHTHYGCVRTGFAVRAHRFARVCARRRWTTGLAAARLTIWWLFAFWSIAHAALHAGEAEPTKTGAAEPTKLWVTVVTHFDRPWAMEPHDLEALERLIRAHPRIRWTHLFNPVAYTQETPLRDAMEQLLRREQAAQRAEIGVHVHMYQSLAEKAGVPFRRQPSADARQIEGSFDETGYAVPISAYSPEELGAVLAHAKREFAAHNLGVPRTFCAGFYIASPALQRQLIEHGFLVSAAAFPQNVPHGKDYAPSWQELCGWQGAITHLTRPYWVSEKSILPQGGPPYLRGRLGPLLEAPQTCKIDWMMTADEMLVVFREHLAVARSGQATAICLAMHEVSIAEEGEKFDRVFTAIEEASAAKEPSEGDVVLRFTTCAELREEFIEADWKNSLHPAFSTFRPHGLLRLQQPADVEKKRAELIRFIWPSGLPETRPQAIEAVVRPESAIPLLAQDSMASMERWLAAVPPTDYQAVVYFLSPKKPAQRRQLAIVHAGHVRNGPENYLSDGLQQTIESFLERGLHVAAMQMPLTGWHQLQAIPPDQSTFAVSGHRVRNHDELFAAVGPELKGRTFAIFLEPVVQTINEFEARFPRSAPTIMTGLSGGGWTTHMAAAVDARIALSIPVAGAMPLYARRFSPASWGDAEQVYEPLYGEADENGDSIEDQARGVASWLEIFALGGLGERGSNQQRRQIQLLNYYDSCCFGGEAYRTYDKFLHDAVNKLGGTWELVQDRSHQEHLVSEHSLHTVILPAIERTIAE